MEIDQRYNSCEKCKCKIPTSQIYCLECEQEGYARIKIDEFWNIFQEKIK